MALKKSVFCLGNFRAEALSLTWGLEEGPTLDSAGELDLTHFTSGRNILKTTSHSCEFLISPPSRLTLFHLPLLFLHTNDFACR